MPIRFLGSTMTLNKLLVVSFLFCCSSVEATFMDVRTSKDYLKIPTGQELILKSKLAPKCYKDDNNEMCFPTNKLFLKTKRGTKDFSKLVSKWDYFFVYFVKLTKSSHVADLDNDGIYEVAIAPNVAGNNVIIDAYIYSVSNTKLIPYGKGQFNIEYGTHVTDIKVRPHLNH